MVKWTTVAFINFLKLEVPINIKLILPQAIFYLLPDKLCQIFSFFTFVTLFGPSSILQFFKYYPSLPLKLSFYFSSPLGKINSMAKVLSILYWEPILWMS